MLKFGLIAAVVLSIVFASVGYFLAQKAPPANVAAMNLAVAVRQAQRGLPEFRKRLEKPRETDRAFFIRVEMVDSRGKSEYLWIKKVRLSGDDYVGTIDEEPLVRTDLHKGEEVTVAAKDVVDWTILHQDKTVEGAFTRGHEIAGR